MARGASVHEGEVGAAMEHVEVDAVTNLEALAHAIGEVLSIAANHVLAPAIEPAIPELHAHEGPVLAMLLVEGLEGSEVLRGTRTEVASCEHVVVDEGAGAQATAPRAVGGAERHVHAALDHEVADGAQVVLIFAIRAVLILDLHHDDVATMRNLALHQDGHEAIVVARNVCQEGGVVRTDAHGALGQQPRGQAAPLPLGADEGAGAHDGPQAELGSLVKEAREVLDAGEVEYTGLGLVHVPRHVGLNRVETHGLQVIEGMVPIGGMDTRVVDRTREDRERFPIK
ncbi:unknown [Collinsella sp. CAG:398]|nr:unknown [Collinsella sp. CAG:398]